MLFRIRSFYREPAAVFWTYGFPLILTVSLGIAFRNKPVEKIRVDIEDGPTAQATLDALAGIDDQGAFEVAVHSPADCKERLRLGRASVVVASGGDQGAYAYRYDPTRPESTNARHRVDDALQRAAGRTDPVAVRDETVSEPGSRYIDFLVPGLLGMNLLGSGLWGVGFVTVDLRVRKLLKRFVATPMRRSHFLGAVIGGRMLFIVPEMFIILMVGVWIFGIPVRGSWIAIGVVALVGGVCFAGIGLLVACRAQRTETVAGLMNMVMLPMWLLSGIFFNTENFPAAFQPVVRALPLTHLNEALRAVILEGAPLSSQWLRLVILLAFSAVSFTLALKWFRWV